jgi:hypothetical protein
MRNGHKKILSEIIEEIGHLGDLGRDERIKKEYILKIGCQDILVSPGSESGLVAGYCEKGNEPSDFIKCREFTYQLSDYQSIMNDSDPWN